MESVLVTVCNYGVAGICSTIEAGANVVVLWEDVDEFAFALIAPLGAKYDCEFRFLASDAGLCVFADSCWEPHKILLIDAFSYRLF